MTESQASHYRRLLQVKEAELAAGLHRRDEIAVQQTADELDGVTLAQQRDFAIGQLDRAAGMLRNVRDALDRLEQGEYGICLRCDTEIRTARLTAVPWTAYCRDCQEAIDREAEEALAEPVAAGSAAIHRTAVSRIPPRQDTAGRGAPLPWKVTRRRTHEGRAA